MSTENVSAGQLLLFIERIERLEEDKQGIVEDIKDVFVEAKGAGFDTKTIRAVVALRRLPRDTRDEQEALLETYKAAIGLADPAEAAPRRDPAAERIQDAIVDALRAAGRVTIVALKTLIRDKGAKALGYADLTVHLGELIEAGRVESGTGRVADVAEYWVRA
ncbi:MAG: DUF2312 domain-containing protein [Sphingomonadaceae bacterium]|nr:DUF2312 domain-containing protein [Sphingomonadaceae bacterium]